MDFQVALGILATIPMTKADLNIKVTVEDDYESRRLILGPRSRMGVVCDRLLQGDEAARAAVACHAFGDEKDSRCGDCRVGPFGGCVVYRNKSNNVCSNCIYTGRERLYEWRTKSNLDSDEEHDYIPPKRRARRTRRYAPKRPVERAEGDQVHSSPSKRRRRSTAESDYDGSKLSEFIDLTMENDELMGQ